MEEGMGLGIEHGNVCIVLCCVVLCCVALCCVVVCVCVCVWEWVCFSTFVLRV